MPEWKCRMMNKQRAGIPFGPDIPNATRFNGESVVLTLTDQIRQIIDYLAIWFYGNHIRLITVILQFVVKAIFLECPERKIVKRAVSIRQ